MVSEKDFKKYVPKVIGFDAVYMIGKIVDARRINPVNENVRYHTQDNDWIILFKDGKEFLLGNLEERGWRLNYIAMAVPENLREDKEDKYSQLAREKSVLFNHKTGGFVYANNHLDIGNKYVQKMYAHLQEIVEQEIEKYNKKKLKGSTELSQVVVNQMIHTEN